MTIESMTLLVLGHDFAYEMENLVRMFFPGIKLDVMKQGDIDAPFTITTRFDRAQKQIHIAVNVGKIAVCAHETVAGCGEDEALELAMARLLYTTLRKNTGITQPWGILTGVRPVRLFRAISERLGSDAQALFAFENTYLVRPDKAQLAMEIAENERALLSELTPNGFSLYIGIPFCPSRCHYCSFVSHDISGVKKLVPDYLRLLCDEIRMTGEIVQRLGRQLQTIYIGGGTPTTLEADQLATIMRTVKESFDFSSVLEYTVEAGRPDTITSEKLSAIVENGADRISVNPQTMDDTILSTIGRNHTAEETIRAFELARKAQFKCVNMDLIAGLPGESGKEFIASVQKLIQLKPENITVHTLTVKRSSGMRDRESMYQTASVDLPCIVEEGHSQIIGAGYTPYYMYRQKGTLANLHNTGYSLSGYEGLYNVLIMEEVQTILAVGCGAVTKIFRPGQKLERIFNFKYPFEYISRFSEIKQRKYQTEMEMRDNG